jgi:nucleotide-binding universal stress UspA family protein
MTTVLLATDGSNCARRAAERAVDIARDRAGSLHVVWVVDNRKFGESALGADALATIWAEDHGHDCVQNVASMGRDAGVDVSVEVVHGRPADRILDSADRLGAEVIVVGEHGDHREHIGGVGRRVTAGCDCEVVTVPRASTA